MAGAGQRGLRPQHRGVKQVNNAKYAQFVEPGQTLTVTAELLGLADGEAKLKAYGTVGGRIIVSARLILACYNLADSNPQHEAADAATRQDLRRPTGIAPPAAGGNPRQHQQPT